MIGNKVGGNKVGVIIMFCIAGISSGFSQSRGVSEYFLTTAGVLDIYEVYLDRADMEREQEDWLGAARFGITAVSAEWERQVLLLQEAGYDVEVGRERIGEILEKRMEERLSGWLVEEFFHGGNRPDLLTLLSEIADANDDFLYIKDGDLYVYDDSGDPVMLTGGGIDEDRETWTSRVGSVLDSLARSWEDSMRDRAAELLVLLPGEETEENLLRFESRLSAYRDGYRRELTALFMAEESRFMSRRLRDQYSLRKKSEEVTAASITAGIIEKTKLETDDVLTVLRTGLSQEMDVPDASGLHIDEKKWRESFRIEFDRGMEKWNRAEEELLSERMRYEQAAVENFAAAEKAWTEAYYSIHEARREWELNLTEILAEGKEIWEEKETALALAIDDAREELDRAIRERSGSLNDRIENLVEMLLTSGETMRTARASGEYWLERVRPGMEFGSMELDEYLQGLAPEDQENKNIRELIFWLDIYHTYEEHAEAANTSLTETYGIVLYDRETDPGNEATHPPYAEIIGNAAWEYQYLDDYQVELLKSAALEDYWRKELEIARGVYDYAVDTSSERMTEAETEAAYEAALSAYEAAGDNYTLALAGLRDAGTELSSASGALSDIRVRLEESKAALEEARDGYNMAMDLFITENDGFYKEKIGDYYGELLRLYGLKSGEEEDGLPEARVRMFAAAKRYMAECGIEDVTDELTKLVAGDGKDGTTEALSVLEERRDEAASWGFSGDPDMFEERLLLCFGLEEGNPYRSQFLEAFGAYTAAAGEGDNLRSWYYRTIIEELAGEIIEKTELAYKQRRELIGFLTSRDMKGWMEDLGFNSEEDVDGAGWFSVLRQEAETASANYFLEKASIERGALILLSGAMAESGAGTPAEVADGIIQELLSGAGEGEPAASLGLAAIAGFGSVQYAGEWDEPFIKERIETLAGIETFLHDTVCTGESAGLSGYAGAIREMGEKDPFVLEFFRGKGSFSPESGVNIESLILSGSFILRREREERYAAAERYRDIAPHLLGEDASSAVDKVISVLTTNGLVSASGESAWELCVPDLVWSRLEGEGLSGVEKEEWFAELSEHIVIASASLPAYAAEDLYSYLEALGKYIILRSDASGTPIADIDRLETETEELAGLVHNTDAAYSVISGGTETLLRLAASWTVLRNGIGEPQFDEKAVEPYIADYAGVQTALIMSERINDPPLWEEADSALWEDTVSDILKPLAIEADSSFIQTIADKARAYYKEAFIYSGTGIDFGILTGDEQSAYCTGLWNAYDTEEFIFPGFAGFTEGTDASAIFAAAVMYSYGREEWSEGVVTQDDIDRLLQYMFDTADSSVYGAAESLCSGILGLDRAGRYSYISDLLGLSGGVSGFSLLNEDDPGRGVYDAAYTLSLGAALYEAGIGKEDIPATVSILTNMSGGPDTNTDISPALFDAYINAENEVERTALLFGGSSGGLLYLAKKQLLSREDTGFLDPLLTQELSQEEAAALLDFRDKLRTTEAYIYGIDHNYASAAETVDESGSFDGAAEAASLLRQDRGLKIWSDPILYAGIGNGIQETLLRLGAKAEYSALGAIDCLSEIILTCINKAESSLLKKEYQLDLRKNAALLQEARAGFRKTYRAYLGTDFCSGGPAGAEMNGTIVFDTDTEGSGEYQQRIVYSPGGYDNEGRLVSGDWYENQIIEEANAYMMSGRELLESLNSAAVTAPIENGLTADFYSLFTGIDETINAILDGDPTDLLQVSAASEREYKEALQRVSGIEANIAYMKEEIANIGAGLELYAGEKQTLMASVIEPLKNDADLLEAEYLSLQERWSEAAAAFTSVNTAYETAFDELRSAEEAMENREFSFRKAEALMEFASSGYLKSSSVEYIPELGAETAAIDPSDRLAFAEVRYANARAAYDALSFLYDGEVREDFIGYGNNSVYLDAFEKYRHHYKNHISLRQLNGLLNEAVAEQQKRVDAAENKTVTEMEAVLGYGGDKTGQDREDFYLETPEIRGWYDYVSGLVESGGEQVLFRWSLASWYLDNGGRSDAELKELADGLLAPAAESVNRQDIDTAELLRSIGQSAYRMMGVKEREAFTTYLALSSREGYAVSSAFEDVSAKRSGFLNEQMTVELNERVSAVCSDFAGRHRSDGDTLMISAGVNMGLAAAFIWCPPVFAMYSSIGAVFAVLGGEQYNLANQMKESAAKTDANAAAAGEIVRLDTGPIVSALNNYRQYKAEWLNEVNRYQALTLEKQGGEVVEAGEFVDSVLLAGEILGEDIGCFVGMEGADSPALRRGLSEMISATGYFDRLEITDRSDSMTMVSSLAILAGREKDTAYSEFQVLAAEKHEEQAAAVKLYTAAFENVVNAPGLAELTELGAALKAAFGKPAYRNSDHLGRLVIFGDNMRDGLEPGIHDFAGTIESELSALQGRSLSALYEGRMNTYRAVKEAEWAGRLKELQYRRSLWEDTLSAIADRGTEEWRMSIARLETERSRWLDTYVDEYEKRLELWDKKYSVLVMNKNEWVEEAAASTVRAGKEAVVRQLGMAADSGIKEAGSITIPDMENGHKDPEEIVHDVLGNGSFSGLLQRGDIMNRGIGAINVRLSAALGGSGFQSSKILQMVDNCTRKNRDLIEDHIAVLTAVRAREGIADAVNAFKDAVENANIGVDESVDRMLFGEAFQKETGIYVREVLVDDTVATGLQHEIQTIEDYEYYKLPDIVLGVDLSEALLTRLTPLGVEAQITKAINALGEMQKEIFGDPGREDEKGIFGEYVGEAAAMVSEGVDLQAGNIEANIENPGTGEIGRITKALIIFNLLERRGWRELNKPVYEKRMWDDDGSWFKAPTIRGLADIGMSILTTAVLGPAGTALAAAGANLIDDALFTITDIAGGYKSEEEALLSIGTKAAAGFAAAGINTGFNSIQGFLGDGLTGNITESFMKQFSSNTAGGIINSLELDPMGKIGFNADLFGESIAGKGALAGYLGAAAGITTSDLLTGSIEGLEGTDIASKINAVSGLAGSAASAGIGYALAGETSLNLLNIGKGPGGTGLLELKLSRENGVSMNFGMGGTDVSMGRLYNAAGSLGTWFNQQRIRAFDAFGKIDLAASYKGYEKAGTALRSMWAYGDTAAADLIENLLSGKDKLRVGYSTGAEGQTVKSGDGRTISISTLGSSDDIVSKLRSGIILQHEAWRDGVVRASDVQKLETQTSVAAHTEMGMRLSGTYGADVIAGDVNLLKDVNAYLSGTGSFQAYVDRNYSSGSDFWRLKGDGDLEFDGDGWLRDEKGNLILDENNQPVGSDAIEGGLAGILDYAGLGVDNAAYFLRESGFNVNTDRAIYNPADTDSWWWDGEGKLSNMGKPLSLGDRVYSALTNGVKLTPLESSLINTNLAVTSEIGKMDWELRMKDDGYSKREINLYMDDVRKNFDSLTDIGTYDTAGDMLDVLRSGLTEMKGNDGHDFNSHNLLRFTNNIFRGGELSGDLGLAEALRNYNQYEWIDLPNSGVASLLSNQYGIGSAEEYGGRMTVTQIAETFTGEYMNIDYGAVDAKGKEPGSVYKGNYNMPASYGDYTIYRSDGQTSVNTTLDCVGYAQMVHHAAGLLDYGESINEAGGADGVLNTFNSGYVTPTSTPKLGDFIFMEDSLGSRHIGILGMNDYGNFTMYHSAPDPVYLGLASGESGPRINTLPADMDLGKTEYSKDPYIRKLIEMRMFKNFKDEHDYYFGSFYEN